MVLIRLPVAVLTAAAVLTTACTTGPNYKRPVVEIPSAHRGAADATQAGASASLADLKWFDVFRDD
ncbi:MAG TPA: hypothetical protein VK595_13550, partial [Vicinamibacterales bacterium]|nr:hypothetical protein [Vicinamibacterales bacterium]